MWGVKGGSPTFHAEYHNGVYKHPIPSHPNRIHPTQKSDALFREIIERHTNAGDLVVDPFLGGGTTLMAAFALGRRFAGCDISAEYMDAVRARFLSEAVKNG